MLQIQAVEPNTLELLGKLQGLSQLKDFRLVGGTSLALQIGHRLSVDLDFFSYNIDIPTDVQYIVNQIGGSIENVSLSERIKIYSIDNIKVDFVNYFYPWIREPLILDGISLASLEDIAAMKLSAITNRGKKKDFIDLFFLFDYFSFQEMIELYHQKYKDAADFLLLKSLIYFEDAEEEPMPKMLKPISWEEVKFAIISTVKNYIG